jgi:hypothetical protein
MARCALQSTILMLVFISYGNIFYKPNGLQKTASRWPETVAPDLASPLGVRAGTLIRARWQDEYIDGPSGTRISGRHRHDS